MGAGPLLLCVHVKVPLIMCIYIHDLLSVVSLKWLYGSVFTIEHIRTPCETLTWPRSGMVSYSKNGTVNNIPVGTVATYSCDPGHIVTGDMTRTCQSNGSWDGSDPTCDGKELDRQR